MIPKARNLTPEELQAFAPPADLRKGLKDSRTALNLTPLASLTSSLRPQPNKRIFPPLFRFGYAVTWEWALEYAKKHGLLRPTVYDSDRDIDYDVDDPELDTPSEESTLPVSDAVDRESKVKTDEEDLDFSIEEIIDHINDNSGTRSVLVTKESICPLPCYIETGVRYWLIGITSNYDTRPKPTPEDLIRLHHYLGFKTLPAWFLDLTECGWGSRSTVKDTRHEYLCSLSP